MMERDPAVVITDREASRPARRRALQQLADRRRLTESESRALVRTLFEPGFPVSQREKALAILEQRSADVLVATLDRRLHDLPDWPTMHAVLAVIERRKWQGLTPAVVRAWAWPSQRYDDDERPERQLIKRLNPGRSVEQTIAEVWLDAENELDHRIGAWQLLARIRPPEVRVGLLDQVAEEDTFGVTLRAGYRQLNVLPGHREQIRWLMHLAVAEPTFWAAARRAVDRLAPDRRQGLALRHLPTLVALSAAGSLDEKPSCSVRVQRHLGRTTHFHRTAPDQRGVELPDQSLTADDHRQMAWADWCVVQTLIKTLERFSEIMRQKKIPHLTYHGDLNRQDRRTVQEIFMEQDNQ
ncbi:MAG: hypothetical protein R3336_03475, partial [Phycisphaeraceae bacterium]|nr:hypothetical protein [Phycisphaeraceae bacterium]